MKRQHKIRTGDGTKLGYSENMDMDTILSQVSAIAPLDATKSFIFNTLYLCVCVTVQLLKILKTPPW